MTEKDMPKADFITSIVLIAFSVAVIIVSYQMPRFENRGASIWEGPGLVPGILGAIIGLLGIYVLVRSIKQGGYSLGLSGDKLTHWFKKPATFRLLLTIALTIGYAWGLLGNVPYTLATFLFVAVFIIVFEYNPANERQSKVKKAGTAVLTAVIATTVISAVFQYGFLIRLP